MNKSLIYLDNNATTRVDSKVVSAMLPVLQEHYGNPSSRHFLGLKAAEQEYYAREKLASLLGCQAEELIFTSGGTESNNLAILGTAVLLPKSKNHIITTLVEHPAVKKAIAMLLERGFEVTELKVDKQGLLDLETLKQNISEKTGLVSIMYANNETGVVFPIEEIGKIVRKYKAIFHVDAVQAIAKISLDIKHLPVDLLTVSGHKFHAPKGIGALYVRQGVKLRPQIVGGHQEQGIRGGTEALPNIVAIGAAAELSSQALTQIQAIEQKRNRLESGLLEKIPHCAVNGSKEYRVGNTSNISFRDVEGECIVLALSKIGICVSTGAACASGSVEPSSTLRAMKVHNRYLPGSIRFSLSRYTTDEEIDFVLENVPSVIKKLRDISKFTRKF